jgi:hypothetical protein
MDRPIPTTATGGAGRLVPRIVVAVAIVLQLVVLVPFTVASGLVAPLWAIIALHALWVAGAVGLALLARRRPLATPLVPAVNAALLWAAITVGEAWLGWTA